MCGTCGCGTDHNGAVITKLDDNHGHYHHDHTHHDHHHHHHHHDHEHHSHDHIHHISDASKQVLEIEQDILQHNQVQAARNRGYFEGKDIYALNLVSSPGSGKTALLECTLRDLKEELDFFVIEGDQQTLNDANRIKAHHVPVIQINTGKGCHLESDMVYKAAKELDISSNSVLMIENVGNLVCPSLFDLGENERVVIISTTEGEDKPLKYPDMFYSSGICIINKIDLLPHLNFNMETLKKNALSVNPNLEFFELSCTSGEGLENWYDWLKKNIS